MKDPFARRISAWIPHMDEFFEVVYVISGTVDGSEIPNNHHGIYKTVVNNGINYQPELVSRISEPSTVWLGICDSHSHKPRISNGWEG